MDIPYIHMYPVCTQSSNPVHTRIYKHIHSFQRGPLTYLSLCPRVSQKAKDPIGISGVHPLK